MLSGYINMTSRNMFKTAKEFPQERSHLFKVFKIFTKFYVSLLKFGKIYSFLGFVVTLQHLLDEWTEKLWMLTLLAVIGKKIRTTNYPFSQKYLVRTRKVFFKRICLLPSYKSKDWDAVTDIVVVPYSFNRQPHKMAKHNQFVG